MKTNPAKYVVLLSQIPKASLLGMFIIALSGAEYVYLQGFMYYITPERAQIFERLAYLQLLLLSAGAGFVAYGLGALLIREIESAKSLGSIPLKPHSLIAYLLSRRKYVRIFAASALFYGLFYSVVTSVIVYQPTINFSQAYGAQIPSAIVAPCCGPPLASPIVVVYLTEHLGLLLIPLTLMLLAIVSTLVGLNVALSFFAFENRAKRGGGWLGGLGAVVGLFTGCPTCAGLFLASLIGGAGAVSAATLLASYQPLFVGVSIPVLMVTPLLISRNLAKVFTGGCIILAKKNQSQLG